MNTKQLDRLVGFEQVRNELEQDRQVDDRVVSRNRCRYRSDPALLIQSDMGYDEATLTPWAESQLAEKMQIPLRYFRKCTPELKATNMNHWLETAGDESDFLLRLRKRDGVDQVRACLSDRYSTIDNHFALDTLGDVLVENGIDLKVDRYSIQDRYFYLRALFPTQYGTVEDPLYLGFNFWNSEVGARPVGFEGVIYRQVCKNGLLAQAGSDSFNHVHMGLNREDVSQYLRNAILNLQDVGANSIDRFINTKDVKVEEDEAKELLKDLFKRSTASKKFQEAVWTKFDQEGRTLYGLVNSVTEVAQTLQDDARVRVEALVSQLLVAA